jgi:hypothetical protein
MPTRAGRIRAVRSGSAIMVTIAIMSMADSEMAPMIRGLYFGFDDKSPRGAHISATIGISPWLILPRVCIISYRVSLTEGCRQGPGRVVASSAVASSAVTVW